MGLDMYLTKKVEVHKKGTTFYSLISRGAELDEGVEPSKFFIEDDNERIEISADFIGFDLDKIYWRKANAIHNWFVTHIQNDEDDCKPYILYEEKIIELRDVCKSIIEEEEEHGRDKAIELADELLPTSDGFSFGDISYVDLGDTSYNDYYFDTVKETYDEIVRIIKTDEMASGKGYVTHIFYEYRSSW